MLSKGKATQYSSGLNLNYGNEKWNLYSDVSYTENKIMVSQQEYSIIIMVKKYQ